MKKKRILGVPLPGTPAYRALGVPGKKKPYKKPAVRSKDPVCANCGKRAQVLHSHMGESGQCKKCFAERWGAPAAFCELQLEAPKPAKKPCPRCGAPLRPCTTGEPDLHCDKCDRCFPIVAGSHLSSDGCRVDGPPGRECGCQSCRAEFGPPVADSKLEEEKPAEAQFACGGRAIKLQALDEARALVKKLEAEVEPCGCGCKMAGIGLFDTGREENVVQACDACGYFSDEGAAAVVTRLLRLLGREHEAFGGSVLDALTRLESEMNAREKRAALEKVK